MIRNMHGLRVAPLDSAEELALVIPVAVLIAFTASGAVCAGSNPAGGADVGPSETFADLRGRPC
jgi:hypothetical protein